MMIRSPWVVVYCEKPMSDCREFLRNEGTRLKSMPDAGEGYKHPEGVDHVHTRVRNGQEKVVTIEFDRKDKAKEFIEYCDDGATYIWWDRFNDDAHALVWVAEEDDET